MALDKSDHLMHLEGLRQKLPGSCKMRPPLSDHVGMPRQNNDHGSIEAHLCPEQAGEGIAIEVVGETDIEQDQIGDRMIGVLQGIEGRVCIHIALIGDSLSMQSHF
jgi:hypothetical protein